MKVKAAVLRAPHAPFSIEELELEPPRSDEVLVRVVGAGMCHSDLLARELPVEYFPGPGVYGHEGAGVVEEVGVDVTKVTAGDHVVLSFRNCGSCSACSDGHPAYCLRLTELNTAGRRPDGTSSLTDSSGTAVGSHFFGQSSFASHVVAAHESVVRVDASYDLLRVGPLGCGIQTGAGAVFNVFRVREGESIVIAGAGALGLAAVMAANVSRAGSIIAIDRHQNRLELATKFGATDAVSASPDEMTALIQDLTGGGSDYAFDTTGNAQVVRACYNGLSHLGTMGLCGVGFGEVTLDFATLLSGRKLLTVIEGDARPEEFIPYLAQLNAEGVFPFDELIETFPLDLINDAEDASRDGSVVKPVLTFD